MREGESHLERLARKQQEGREQRRGKHQNDPSNKLEAAQAAPPALDIDAALDVFNHWLILKDATPVLAALGCVAANYLPGDPVWLGLVAPPSSAKTEILNSISLLPDVVPIATLTVGALLSGTPRKDREQGAKGGLLRQIGEFGIASLKDFGSVLSMHTETRAEVLAALREIYDGAWTRHLGTSGGRTLHWEGKLGLVFGSTPIIDSYHAVIGQLGDRWFLSRMTPSSKGQLARARLHNGAAVADMRKQLAEAVVGLFATRHAEPQPMSDDEFARIDEVVSLVVRLRGAVARDGRTREMEMILGAEGTARVGLSLIRLLDGLDTLGVPRKTAMEVVLSVAMDSTPPIRRRALEIVQQHGSVETGDVAIGLDLPTTTARRALEELAAYRLVERQKGGSGRADLWVKRLWDQEE
jgi:DeoR-like helix-turn-helix domain